MGMDISKLCIALEWHLTIASVVAAEFGLPLLVFYIHSMSSLLCAID